MSKKKTRALRELSLSELKIKLKELKADLAKEIVRTKTGNRSERAVNLRNLRKDIARILTIISEKEYEALIKKQKEESNKKSQKNSK